MSGAQSREFRRLTALSGATSGDRRKPGISHAPIVWLSARGAPCLNHFAANAKKRADIAFNSEIDLGTGGRTDEDEAFHRAPP